MPDVKTKISGAVQGIVLTAPDIRDILHVLTAFEAVSVWIAGLDSEFTNLHRVGDRLPQLPLLLSLIHI